MYSNRYYKNSMCNLQYFLNINTYFMNVYEWFYERYIYIKIKL